MIYYIPLRAKHFKDTKYGNSFHCPFANALKECFKTNYARECIIYCEINGIQYGHDAYELSDYDMDMTIAIEKNFSDELIRTIEIIKQ